jgi:hypothetical protein
MKRTLDNDIFVEYVISLSKESFSEKEQNFIPKIRINKLTVLVAEELKKQDVEIKNFVWGFYRHGFYSESTNVYIHRKYGSDFNLSTANSIDIEIPDDLKISIKESIENLKKYFVRSRESFFNWIYTKKTPNEYKSFYSAHRNLLNWFKMMDDNLNGTGFQTNLFNKLDGNIEELISEYYLSLEYIEDPEILLLLRDFTDLIEYLTLKLNNGHNKQEIKMGLTSLEEIYDSILNLITPYSITLSGDPKLISLELERHNNRSNFFKVKLKKELSRYYDDFEEKGLLPTFEEIQSYMEEKTKSMQKGNRNIKEIYQLISEN